MSTQFFSREQAKAFYDRFGSRQDWQRIYEGQAIRKLIENSRFETVKSVFELGCGTGSLGVKLLTYHLPADARYTGVDLSSTMVDLSQKRLSGFRQRANVLLSDGSLQFNLEQDSFDRFVSTYVLDLFSPQDISQTFTEAYRILRTGGMICLTSLTHGQTFPARIITRLWNKIHAVRPNLVGGCRPVELLDFLKQRQWQLEYHNVVTILGLSSEIMVATKRGHSV